MIKDDKAQITAISLSIHESTAADISDPSVTKADMFIYGYGWDGMIPLEKERALELYDSDCEIYLLYQDDTEGAAESRGDILSHDGMFGIETPGWVPQTQTSPIEVFIANFNQPENSKIPGEWLALPSNSDTLRGLLERIGVDRPSEDAFTVTAIRVPDDFIRDHVSKHDSLDELNMLASRLKDMGSIGAETLQAVGIVPDEYKIVDGALRGLHKQSPEHGLDKPSVVEQIKAARQAAKQPIKDAPQKHKSKGGPEL